MEKFVTKNIMALSQKKMYFSCQKFFGLYKRKLTDYNVTSNKNYELNELDNFQNETNFKGIISLYYFFLK